MNHTAMTDEQINEKIAFELVWRQLQDGRWKRNGRVERSTPNYCNDLNATHEAIQSLDHATRVHSFRRALAKAVGVLSDPEWESSLSLLDKLTNATARQRAEAFLRTLDLWEE